MQSSRQNRNAINQTSLFLSGGEMARLSRERDVVIQPLERWKKLFFLSGSLWNTCWLHNVIALHKFPVNFPLAIRLCLPHGTEISQENDGWLATEYIYSSTISFSASLVSLLIPFCITTKLSHQMKVVFPF